MILPISFLFIFLGSVLVSPPGSETALPQDGESSASEVQAAQIQSSGIGTVVELKGEAWATSENNPESRKLVQNDPIYLHETITTGTNSSIQVELSDETLFSISAESDVRVDELTYDEAAKDGSFSSVVTKGIFRFISGKIAKVKPEKVNIEIPSGTIGIRGTIVVGEIEGEKCLVSLEAEEGDKAQHRIVVSNKISGQIQEVEITQPGFGTVIEGRGQGPKPVFQLPEENRNRFNQNLPTPKFLPRDAGGIPQHNPQVNLHLVDRPQAGGREEDRGNAAQVKEGENSSQPGDRRDEKSAKGPLPPSGPGGPEQNSLQGQQSNLDSQFPGGLNSEGRNERHPEGAEQPPRQGFLGRLFHRGAEVEERQTGPGNFGRFQEEPRKSGEKFGQIPISQYQQSGQPQNFQPGPQSPSPDQGQHSGPKQPASGNRPPPKR